MENKLEFIGIVYHNELEGVPFGDASIGNGIDLTDVLHEIKPNTKIKITIEELHE